MSSTIIEVSIPVANLAVVRQVIDQCTERTGDLLIGQQTYADYGEALLVVQLLNNAAISEHTPVLGQALRGNVITSFQCMVCELVTVTFQRSLSQEDVREALKTFPFRWGESWFTSLSNEQGCYLSLHSGEMSAAQKQWLQQNPTIENWQVGMTMQDSYR